MTETMPGGPDHPVVREPHRSTFLTLPEGVRLLEEGPPSPGVAFPRGFLAAGVAAGIKESGRPDVGLVTIAPPYRANAAGAGVFTRNSFAAAPVLLCRRATNLNALTAVVMNSGNANACTGAPGLEVARSMQAACAEALGVPPNRVGVASTGIIGVPLDEARVTAGIRAAAAGLREDAGEEFAAAIMTTDRFAKRCALEVQTRQGPVRLGGVAKGAGMIAPGLATMLCLVVTDAALEAPVARSLLAREVGRTMNRISVDGEMSTNDSVFFMASGASGLRLSADGAAQLGQALRYLLLRLALMMVADGEGATKVMRLRLQGAPSDEQARTAARAVANSPLVKTAMFGGDPNWGRILSAAGAALPDRSFPEVTLAVGGVQLVERGLPLALEPEEWARLREAMAGPEIPLEFDLGAGPGGDEVYFADLGHEYVTINAEYHT